MIGTIEKKSKNEEPEKNIQQLIWNLFALLIYIVDVLLMPNGCFIFVLLFY